MTSTIVLKQVKEREKKRGKKREKNHFDAFKKAKFLPIFLRKNETSNPYKSRYMGYEETRLARRKSALHSRETRIPDAATFATPTKYIYIRKEREDFRPLFSIIHVTSSLFSQNSAGLYPRCILAAIQLFPRLTFRFPPKSLPPLSPSRCPLDHAVPYIHPSNHPSIHVPSRTLDSFANCARFAGKENVRGGEEVEGTC